MLWYDFKYASNSVTDRKLLLNYWKISVTIKDVFVRQMVCMTQQFRLFSVNFETYPVK